MPDISFNEIPTTRYRLPGTDAEIRPRKNGTGVFEYPTATLLFLPMIAGSLGAPNVPFRITRVQDVTARCGAGSAGEDMADAFLRANPFSELWGVCISEPGGGTAATLADVFTGTPTAPGTIARRIGGRRYTVNISTADTPTTIAKALRDQVNADPQAKVVASWVSGATGTCTYTAKHASTLGNEIAVQVNPAQGDATPPGLSLSLSGQTFLAGGAGALDLTAAISAAAATWYAYMALPVSDVTNLGLIITDLDRRYLATSHLDCQAFGALRGTLSALTAFGPARNARLLSLMGMPASTPQPAWRIAAMCAARAAYYLSEDPARQLRSLTLLGMLPPVDGNFIDSERNLLLLNGISTFLVQPDGTCTIERMVTTNVTDNSGVANDDYADVTGPAVDSRIRYDFRMYLQSLYPRHKLAPNGSPAAEGADNVATFDDLLGSWAARCVVYERAKGWIVNAADTIAQSVCQPPASGARNRADMQLVYRRIDNLIRTNIALEFQA